ncbi:MAG: cation-translocating P-type ATPase [bacterium]
MSKLRILIDKFDIVLVALLVLALIGGYAQQVINMFIGSDWPNILLLVSAILGTIPVLYSAYRAVINRKISVDLLAAAALVFSLLAGEWIAAVFINLMLTAARIFMSYNERRARNSIDALLKLKPHKVRVQRGSHIVDMDPKDVMVGDLVMVQLGERVSVDGVVHSGEASVDESSLTGESIPVNKVVGDKALSSTMVVSGNLIIKTEKVAGDTTLEKIIKMVEDAQLEKPDIHTSAEKFATWYLFTVFIGTILAYALSGNVMMTLAILLVVCADDVAVAVPLTFLTAISFCAKKGIIIKGASYLEVLGDVKTIFVDKTGTLTKGKLKVEKFVSLDDSLKSKNLQIGGMLTSLSEHPISKTIFQYVCDNKCEGRTIPDKMQELPGKGLIAHIAGEQYFLGKRDFAKEFGLRFSAELEKQIDGENTAGYNVTVIGVGQEIRGYFVLADELKAGLKEQIQELKDSGVEEIIMLTGDNEKVAKRIADTIGLTSFHANLLPQQKLEIIKEAQKKSGKKRKMAMVGDGVNDAAALTLSDVGIAMGGAGLDAAIESADIVLMKDDFGKIPELIKISKYVMKISNQDFWLWGISNGIGLALVLTSFLAPTGASLYNFLTDFIPLINSTRVFKLYFGRR